MSGHTWRATSKIEKRRAGLRLSSPPTLRDSEKPTLEPEEMMPALRKFWQSAGGGILIDVVTLSTPLASASEIDHQRKIVLYVTPLPTLQLRDGPQLSDTLFERERDMVYEWDAHEQTCYRLYIDERKSLEEIMNYMRMEHKFTPSKRAFQIQFRRWEFPSKQNPAHKNDRLVTRIKELWEKNLSQKEMLRILNDVEGFDIKQRELMRVRTRNRWLLREPNSDQKTPKVMVARADDAPSDPQSIDSSQSPEASLEQPLEAGDSGSHIAPEAPAKRWEPNELLEAEAGERWESRKRRRRTRAWNGLPADPPGPPRFPSETTIDESRVILALDPELYRDLRSRFIRICEDTNVSKKTLAGPERWEGVKHRLIEEMPHLQSVMWVTSSDADGRKLALDVICTDVTKRLRSSERKMTIAEAKNALGVNPAESRTIRQEYVAVLRDSKFTRKSETGQKQWEELKSKWLSRSTILQRVLSGAVTDPTYEDRLRATEFIAQDVMKRLRDEQSKREPKKRTPTTSTNTPSVVRPRRPQITETVSQRDGKEGSDANLDHEQDLSLEEYPRPQTNRYDHLATSMIRSAPHSPNSHGSRVGQGASQLIPTEQSLQHTPMLSNTLTSDQTLAHSPVHIATPLITTNGLPIDPQIDGSLPVLINSHGTPLSQHTHSPYMPQALSPGVSQQQSHSYVTHPFDAQSSHCSPVAVYLRLHASSTYTMAPAIWITTLTARTFDELTHVAVKDMPGTICGRVEGILGEGMTIEISRDDELTAYLTVVESRDSTDAQGAPTFYVQVLAAGWKA